MEWLDPVQAFDDEFPRTFQGTLVSLVASTYVESLDLVKGELEEEIAPVWGVFRRGKIEGGLRTLVARYGLEARAERNPSGSFHTVIESEHFCMTESRVLEASRVPRRALFREIHAVNNYPLFASIEAEEPPDEKRYSAILIHGPSRLDRTRLGFVMIRFPSPDCSQWLDPSINLLERFPNPSPASAEFQQEVIPQPLSLRSAGTTRRRVHHEAGYIRFRRGALERGQRGTRIDRHVIGRPDWSVKASGLPVRERNPDTLTLRYAAAH